MPIMCAITFASSSNASSVMYFLGSLNILGLHNIRLSLPAKNDQFLAGIPVKFPHGCHILNCECAYTNRRDLSHWDWSKASVLINTI